MDRRLPMCIVLDLDETLIHCANSASSSNLISFVISQTFNERLLINVRPYFLQFLEFCVKEFDEIYVYTAGTESYAVPIMEKLFGRNTLNGFWTREKCQLMSNNVIIKPLWDKTTARNTCLDQIYTLIIDDRGDVAEAFPLFPHFGAWWRSSPIESAFPYW